MTAADRYDVAIVGASTAGCTAARLFGQAGVRVALIKRRPHDLPALGALRPTVWAPAISRRI